MVLIDLRSDIEFKRAHVKNSINIPFTSVTLEAPLISTLNVVDLEQRLTKRIVVVADTMHENAVLVSSEISHQLSKRNNHFG